MQIVYTLTDEAPALATYSWLPVLQAFSRVLGITVETKDISLAARILSQFPDFLRPEQRRPDFLAELGKLVEREDSVIIKLPNISASIPQLQGAIQELKKKGYGLPDFPQDFSTPEGKNILARYEKVLGSAVNPILRLGNSDRRVGYSVKEYARKNPHPLGEWSQDSQSHVSSMSQGDFYASEKSVVIENAKEVSLVWTGRGGQTQVLQEKISLRKGEVVDTAVMNCQALRGYYKEEMQKAKEAGVLLSLHLKATMMKVSDPIIFGHAVEVFYREVFEKYREEFSQWGINARYGLGDMKRKIKNLPLAKQREVEESMAQAETKRPSLAMVDPEKFISNLHVPNYVIIDASMPVLIKNSGKMMGADGELQDTKILIPDRCYGGIYQQVIESCQREGAFSVSSMGSVSNVGLMAKKAEEYGSHGTTFEMKESGVVRVLDSEGTALMEQEVEGGDIWRMCRTQDEAVRDWVKLAVSRAHLSGDPAIFWLDPHRPHDACLREKVKEYLEDHDTHDLTLSFESPQEAMKKTLKRVRKGQNTISVTGNVLRDYLTDLFPILELGTSSKMLSIVPLLGGGGLYETGAGGTAPKHVRQFVEENHLRWDSLGEFLALGASLEDLARKTQKDLVKVFAKALDWANGQFLKMNKFPLREVGKLDCRGSHFYLALYWSEALGEQFQEKRLKQKFLTLHYQLQENEKKIMTAFQEVQGGSVDIGGHYWPDPQKVIGAMRPCSIFNRIINGF